MYAFMHINIPTIGSVGSWPLPNVHLFCIVLVGNSFILFCNLSIYFDILHFYFY